MPPRLIDCLGVTEEMAEVFSDLSVLGAMLEFEATLARAQAERGIIPAAAAEAISKAAASVAAFDAAAIAREARQSGTPAIPLVNALADLVSQTDESAARYVHFGATSQDVTDSALVLLLHRANAILARDHAALEERLRALSEEHAATVMLGRTLLQPAPPITFGYKVALWYGAIHRNWKRLSQAFTESQVLQLGGASGTLAATGHVTLSLEIPPWHTHRDRLASVITNCGIYIASLGKIAQDIALLMQPEVGELSGQAGGSSAMPHKRNPSASAVALAAATRTPGLVAAYLAGMVQQHERGLGGLQAEWQTVKDVIEATGSALAAVLSAVETLTVHPDRMRANLQATQGVVFAEKASMLLIPKIGRAAAHELLSAASHEALASRRPFREILKKNSEVTRHLAPQQVDRIDVPEDYLGAAEVLRRHLLNE